MGTHFKQGFTIIETMLVLAITGVLIASLIVGVGGTVNAQRYKDSVNSLQALLQDQYDQVDNVTNVNPRESTWTCDTAANTAEQTAPGEGTAPGQSDCVLMGRYVSIANDTVSTAAVVGYKNSTAIETTDVSDLKTNYAFGIAKDSIETSTLEWGAAIAWPVSGIDSKTAGDRTFAMLVLRSPESGFTYTFTSDSDAPIDATSSGTLKNMMVVGNSIPGQAQRFLCVDPSPGSSGLTVPEKLSVTIDRGASAPSAVEIRTQNVNKDLGQASSCNA